MNKLVLKISSLLIEIVITIALFLMVAVSENGKRSQKYALASAHYQSLYNDWEKYKNDYEKQIQATKLENQVKMAQSKAQYDELLQRQPELIKQNTKIVSKTQPSSGTTQVSKQVQVQKPKSKPVTKSS